MGLYCVMLLSVGEQKMQTIKIYREMNDCGLAEAKRDIENAPVKFIGGLPEDDAYTVSKALRQLGNMTSVESDYDTVMPSDILQRYDIYQAVSIGEISYESSTNMGFSYDSSTTKTTDYSDPWDKKSKNNRKSKNNKKNKKQSKQKLELTQVSQKAETTTVNYSNKSFASTNKRNTSWLTLLLTVGGSAIFLGGFIFPFIFMFLCNIQNNNTPKFEPAPAEPVYDTYPVKQLTTREEILFLIKDSILFNYLANDAFGKDITELSDEEFDSVTYIDFNWDDDLHREMLRYELKDGSSGTISAPRERLYMEYFSIFPSLTYLDSEYMEYTDSYTVYFENLKHIGYEPDMMYKLTGEFDDEAIESVHLYLRMRSTDVTVYKNLEEFEVDLDFISFDFSTLSDLEKLRSVIIHTDYEDIDVTGLIELTQIEKLYIESENFKDVRFIEKLPNLKVFGIENTKVINVDAVANIGDQLEELYLICNYNLDDYSFVNNLVNLKKLAIEDNFSEDVGAPDLSALVNLEELSLGCVHDLSYLYNLTGLKKLELISPYDNDFGFLLDMKELKELHIHRGSLHDSEIYTIAQCESVEELCLYYTFVWDDLSSVLNLPKLKRINLRSASFGIMPDRVNDNSVLEGIYFDWTNIYSLDENGNFYYNNTIIGLSMVSDVFGKFKALKELNIPNSDLQDVDCFLENDNLMFLNISGSYIADLTQLSGKPLQYIRCGYTQIYEFAGFESKCSNN